MDLIKELNPAHDLDDCRASTLDDLLSVKGMTEYAAGGSKAFFRGAAFGAAAGYLIGLITDSSPSTAAVIGAGTLAFVDMLQYEARYVRQIYKDLAQ